MNIVSCISTCAAPLFAPDCAANSSQLLSLMRFTGHLAASSRRLPFLWRSPTGSTSPAQLQSRKVTSCSLSMLPHPPRHPSPPIHFHPRRAGVLETRLPSARLSSAKSLEADAAEEAERGGGRGSQWSPPVSVAPANDRHLIAPPLTPGERRGDGERAGGRAAAARARKLFSLEHSPPIMAGQCRL